MDSIDKFNASHISRYSIKEITGVTPTVSSLIEIFENCPAESALILLSNISVSFDNEKMEKVEDYLRKQLLSAKLNELLEDIEKRTGSRISIFNEMTLQLSLDLCRQYSPNDDSIKKTMREVGQDVAFASLVGNYFCNYPGEVEPLKNAETYTKFAIREGQFNEKDQFRYAMGRANLIYGLLKDQVSKTHQFDVNKFLEETYGFGLEDYFQTIIALYSQWGTQTIEKWDPKVNCMVPEIFFKNFTNHERLLNVVEYLTQEWNPIAPIDFASMSTDELRFYMYSKFDLKSKPLVKINGRIYPMSMRYLILNCWIGPYYLVIDKLRELDKKREPFFHFLGPSTELYCRAQVEHTFGKKFSTIETKLKTPMGDCVVSINPNWQLIFEVKAKRSNLDAITGDKPLKDNSTVRMMLVEPLTQVSDRILEYRKQYHGKITPIIVTAGSLFLNEITWPEYFKLVKHLPIFSDTKVDTPIFLDLETFEILCACIQDGQSISKIIREKNSKIWRHDDFKTFLYHHYLPNMGKGEPVNAPVAAASTALFEQLRTKLSPGSSTTIKAEVDWKKVFKISPGSLPSNL